MHAHIQSFSKSCRFILRSISHLFTSLYFQGHSPCPSHHHLSLERLQLPLYWSSLPSPAIILHPAAQVIFQNQHQILSCCYFKPSVASHCSRHKIQIPHHGLRDPTGFGCCYLLLSPTPLLFARYSPYWSPFCSSSMPCSHIEPLCLMFFLPRMFCHGSWLWLILLLCPKGVLLQVLCITEALTASVTVCNDLVDLFASFLITHLSRI